MTVGHWRNMLDSLMRDIRYACRSVVRTPLVALTIVATVGLGLGMVTVVFTVLNAFIFRVDQVRNPRELFAVAHQQSDQEEAAGFTRTQYEAAIRETAVFSETFATTPSIDTWIEGRRMEGPLVTGNFFQVLGVSAVIGRTLTPADDEPGRPPVIVLSNRAWTTHFARDPGVLTRTILLNGARFTVVGVTPEGFRGLMVAPPDFWAPLSLIGDFRRGQQKTEDAANLEIVGRLKSDLSRSQALAQLVVWDTQHTNRSAGEPVASLVLEPRQGTVPQPGEALLVFMPLFFAFGLILLIGSANVANLLLARAVARQREMGIRLAIGASRVRIISQLLTESLLLSLISAALGFVISRLALAGVVYAVLSNWPPDLGDIRLVVPPADWRVAVFLLAGAMASTLFFALAPALQATRVELLRAIRGEVLRDARPGRARNVLVTLQVTASVLLLICAGVFLRSSWKAASVDPGIRTADIVTLNILNEQRRAALLDAMKTEPLVATVAASWPGGLGGRPASADGAQGKSPVTYQFVSPEYFDVLGVDLVRGRGFTPIERSTTAAVAIVSESVAAQLWPGLDAVGQVLRLESDPARDPREADDPPPLTRSLIVVGIARDVAGFRLAGMRLAGAGVYVPIGADAAKTSLTLRIRGDAEQARRAIVNRLASVDPNAADVSTLRTLAGAEAFALSIPFWLTLVLGSLALLLTLSGLFSVLSYLVEQRTREIGVRMALGATRSSIGRLVLSQCARPVGIGVLLGGSSTAAVGAALLATPAAEAIGSTVQLFDPIAYGTSLLVIIAACAGATVIPALRAGRIDPVGALRRD